jgi:hypothetical protein
VVTRGWTGALLLQAAAAVCAMAFLLSLGLVYRLAVERSWQGAAVLSPALQGFTFGAVALAAAVPDASRNLPLLAAGLLAADAVLHAARWKAIASLPGHLVPSHPRLFRSRHQLLAVRAVLVNVLTPVFLFGAPGTAAVALLLAGLGADRFAFYSLSVRETPEAEAAWVEAMMDARLPRR